MKKKQVIIIGILIGCILLLSASAVTVFWFMNSSTAEAEIDYDYFSAWTDIEEFQTLPVMVGKNVKYGKVIDYGSKDYLIDANGTTVEEYQAYLDLLDKEGFVKHSDNGEEAMEGNVYTAAFQKDKLTVVVSHIISGNKTYISATYNTDLSDRMIYKEEYVSGISENSKTKVHMLELNNHGACFIFELKNGRFMIQDSGNAYDAPYLLDYLEELTPGDEKPVVEGWFISHPHADHFGGLQEIATKQKYKDRIYVNEVYFHRPISEMMASTEKDLHIDPMVGDMVEDLHILLKAENGESAKGFRPQIGQRYYFCDMYVDVTMTPEQIVLEQELEDDVNNTSIWLKNFIEGQTFLYGGDASHVSINAAMNIFNKEYFDVDVFGVLHHGINVYDYFTEFVNFKTALYPCFRLGSAYSEKAKGTLGTRFARVEENNRLIEKAEEAFSHANGTVTLTFPYKVGTAQIAKPCDWRYSNTKRPQERYSSGWGWEPGDV